MTAAPQNPTKIGKVSLVGAGPGDPGLITMRGVECLREATAILHDALANDELLGFAKPDCVVESVGKHGKGHLWTQSEIDSRMVQLAQQGHSVVRLKGGDPAVFARTAEELDRLVREKIPFEVVPGITAALAASSYAGIPITHRDWASAAAVITGHSLAIDGGNEADEQIDWPALARFPGTLVIYMGVTTAAQWSQALIGAGKAASTPVALVRRCSLPDQQTITCRLDEVASKLSSASDFRAPVIAIIGAVVPLGRRYDWFTQRRLFGQTVLLTRPIENAYRWTRELRNLGANVFNQPLIATHEIAHPTPRGPLPPASFLVLTSQQGVRSLFGHLQRNGQDARALAPYKIATVGPATANEFRKFSIEPDLSLAKDLNADNLAEQIIATSNDTPTSAIIFQASRSSGSLAAKLQSAGIQPIPIIGYEHRDVTTLDPSIAKALAEGLMDWTIVTSSLSAENLVRLTGETLRQTQLLAFSPKIASRLSDLGFPAVAVARQCTLAAVIEAIEESVRQ